MLTQKENLIEERTKLVLQRAALKDQVEQVEKGLGIINFAVQALEADEKDRAPADETPVEE